MLEKKVKLHPAFEDLLFFCFIIVWVTADTGNPTLSPSMKLFPFKQRYGRGSSGI